MIPVILFKSNSFKNSRHIVSAAILFDVMLFLATVVSLCSFLSI